MLNDTFIRVFFEKNTAKFLHSAKEASDSLHWCPFNEFFWYPRNSPVVRSSSDKVINHQLVLLQLEVISNKTKGVGWTRPVRVLYACLSLCITAGRAHNQGTCDVLYSQWDRQLHVQ